MIYRIVCLASVILSLAYSENIALAQQNAFPVSDEVPNDEGGSTNHLSDSNTTTMNANPGDSSMMNANPGDSSMMNANPGDSSMMNANISNNIGLNTP